MSVEELNFKKLSSEKYRVYRLLQSPTFMVETYRRRIKEVGSFRGAVIFPEQIISLYGQQICRVSVSRGDNNIGVGVSIFRNFTLCTENSRKPLNTFDDVLEAEKNDDRFNLALAEAKNSYHANKLDFAIDEKTPAYWFSNKSDGIAFARKIIKL